MKKQNRWTVIFLAVFVPILVLTGALTVYVDPYLHYHSPRTDRFYYQLESERYDNDGILRNCAYDAVIVGSSMMENFRSTLMDTLFSCRSVKVPSSGATLNESANLLKTALRNQPELRYVVRGLDMSCMDEEPEQLTYNMGSYPTYLYNDDLLDDAYYIFNRDAFYDSARMMMDALRGQQPGIINMDEYCSWRTGVHYGKNVAICRTEQEPYENADQVELTQERRERVIYNMQQKIISLAQEYPDTTFYYFLTPYSAAWWGDQRQNGQLQAQLEMEELVIRQLLPCKNIRLFSWNTVEELIFDLRNYKDRIHYGYWVNDWMLKAMAAGEGLLTQENADSYMTRERNLFESFDYNSLFAQADSEQGEIPTFFQQ